MSTCVITHVANPEYSFAFVGSQTKCHSVWPPQRAARAPNAAQFFCRGTLDAVGKSSQKTKSCFHVTSTRKSWSTTHVAATNIFIHAELRESTIYCYLRHFKVFEIDPTLNPSIRVWNGLDQSAGFIIQSSPGGFGLDWIRNSPTRRILDWTGSRNVQSVSHI